MSIFIKMNAKLDSGWKMTNMSCEECRFSLLTNLDSKEIYCPKCDDIKEDKFEYKKEDA